MTFLQQLLLPPVHTPLMQTNPGKHLASIGSSTALSAAMGLFSAVWLASCARCLHRIDVFHTCDGSIDGDIDDLFDGMEEKVEFSTCVMASVVDGTTLDPERNREAVNFCIPPCRDVTVDVVGGETEVVPANDVSNVITTRTDVHAKILTNSIGLQMMAFPLVMCLVEVVSELQCTAFHAAL